MAATVTHRMNESMLLEVSSSTEGETYSPSHQSSGVADSTIASPEAVDALLGSQPGYNGSRPRHLADSVSALDVLDCSFAESDVSRVYDSSAVGTSMVGLPYGVARALSFAHTTTAVASEADSDMSSIHPAAGPRDMHSFSQMHQGNKLFSSFLSDTSRNLLAGIAHQPVSEGVGNPAAAADVTWDTIEPNNLDESIDTPIFRTVVALGAHGSPVGAGYFQESSPAPKSHEAMYQPPLQAESGPTKAHHAEQGAMMSSIFSPMLATSAPASSSRPPQRVPSRLPAQASASLPVRVRRGPRRVPVAATHDEPKQTRPPQRRARRHRARRGQPAAQLSSGHTAPQTALPHAAQYAQSVLDSATVHDTPGRLSSMSAATASSGASRGSRRGKGRRSKRRHSRQGAAEGSHTAPAPRQGAAEGSHTAPAPRQQDPIKGIRAHSESHQVHASAVGPPSAMPPALTWQPPQVPPASQPSAHWLAPHHPGIPPQPPRVQRTSKRSSHAVLQMKPVVQAVGAPRRPPPGMAPAARKHPPRVHAPALPSAESGATAGSMQTPNNEKDVAFSPVAVVPSVAAVRGNKAAAAAARGGGERRGSSAQRHVRASAPGKPKAAAKAASMKRTDPVARFHAMQAVWSSNVTGPSGGRRRSAKPKPKRRGGVRTQQPAADSGDTPWLRA